MEQVKEAVEMKGGSATDGEVTKMITAQVMRVREQGQAWKGTRKTVIRKTVRQREHKPLKKGDCGKCHGTHPGEKCPNGLWKESGIKEADLRRNMVRCSYRVAGGGRCGESVIMRGITSS